MKGSNKGGSSALSLQNSTSNLNYSKDKSKRLIWNKEVINEFKKTDLETKKKRKGTEVLEDTFHCWSGKSWSWYTNKEKMDNHGRQSMKKQLRKTSK